MSELRKIVKCATLRFKTECPGGDREDALVQDREHERADVQHRRIVDALHEHGANRLWLVVMVPPQRLETLRYMY